MPQNQITGNFEKKYCSFNKKYENDFDNFWLWKIQVEKETGHILDDSHFDLTFEKISSILSGWQYPRGINPQSKVWNNLKIALKNISNDYDDLRLYSLLDLEALDIQLLFRIWNQLSMVKQEDGYPTDNPLIVSIGKPLMLIWGQTIALDSRVRENFHRENSNFNFNSRRWEFKRWLSSLYLNYKFLQENNQVREMIERKSLEKYHVHQPVPYGRFLDIYYF